MLNPNPGLQISLNELSALGNSDGPNPKKSTSRVGLCGTSNQRSNNSAPFR